MKSKSKHYKTENHRLNEELNIYKYHLEIPDFNKIEEIIYK